MDWSVLSGKVHLLPICAMWGRFLRSDRIARLTMTYSNALLMHRLGSDLLCTVQNARVSALLKCTCAIVWGLLPLHRIPNHMQGKNHLYIFLVCTFGSPIAQYLSRTGASFLTAKLQEKQISHRDNLTLHKAAFHHRISFPYLCSYRSRAVSHASSSCSVGRFDLWCT